MNTAAPIVVQSETSNFNIGVVLDENNYDLWAPLVEMHIASRRKTGYRRGSLKAPKEDDSKYDDWFSKDQRVKSWLLSAMKPELMKRHIRLPIAAEIWRALKTVFVDEKNEVKIYTLNQKAFRIRQSGWPISVYFGEFYEIFQELDHYNKIAMTCEKDIKIYQELQEQQRVYIFLGGLDDEFEQVHGEILRRDPLPGLQASYAYVRREYDRKIAMKSEVDQVEAMVARNHISQRHIHGDQSKGD